MTITPIRLPLEKTETRYTSVAMGLHWLIAAVIAVVLALGWWMNELAPDHSPLQDRLQWWHVSFGLTLILLVVARIAWRLMNPPPPPAKGLAHWERTLFTTVHLILYALILAQPLLGWMLMSSRSEPVSLWGIPIPALPGVPTHNKAVSTPLKHLHVFWMIWLYGIALVLHVAGALKHQFDGRPVLWRMAPFMSRPGQSARSLGSRR